MVSREWKKIKEEKERGKEKELVYCSIGGGKRMKERKRKNKWKTDSGSEVTR